MHAGRTVGHGAGGAGACDEGATAGKEGEAIGESAILDDEGVAGGGEGAGVPLAGGGTSVVSGAGGMHWVQTVEVDVWMTVDTVVSVSNEVLLPEMMVFVTGQVVTVV